MRRLRYLPPDALLATDMLAGFLDTGSTQVGHTRLTGPEQDRLLTRMLMELERSADGVQPAASSLRELILRHDPIDLISSIAVPAGMVVLDSDPRSGEDGRLTTTWDAKIEYLAGLALSGPPGVERVTRSVTDSAIQLVSTVFDGVLAQTVLFRDQDNADVSDVVDRARFLLRSENLIDRMSGYVCHLETIDAEVFDPHRPFYVGLLGFCPSDIVRLVRRHVRALDEDMRGVRSMWAEGGASEEVVRAFASLMNDSRIWTAESLASRTNLPEREVAAMLTHLSSHFGSQPGFRLPGDPNVIRTRPLINLESAVYFAALPWSLAHNVHAWIQELIREGQFPALGASYQKHRSAAHERLIHSRFSQLFGLERTWASRHYEAGDGHGEIDCMVGGRRVLVIEGKSHSLTPRARQGNADRIERKADDIIVHGLEQSARASAYIVGEGGRTFGRRQGEPGERLLPSEVEEVLQILVTFERMDPLALVAPDLQAPRGQRAWVTSLSDLMMVTDLLDDPATFIDYVSAKTTATSAGIDMYVESDAVATYMLDRFEGVMGAQSTVQASIPIEFASASINTYYNRTEMGIPATRPTTRVPPPLIAALQSTVDLDSELWHRTASAVMRPPADAWKIWRRFVRKHKQESSFTFPAGDLALVTSPTESFVRLISDPTPGLVIPRVVALETLAR